MKRSVVKELYYICHISDLPSLCAHGILSHNEVKRRKLKPTRIADPVIQKRREKLIPGTKKQLHDYANLYFNPRNPMMYKRLDIHEELCVLRISHVILDKTGVIITDGNASSDYTKFLSMPWGLADLDTELVFAIDWTHQDYFQALNRKRSICSEVLVPKNVSKGLIRGIFVSCLETKRQAVEILIKAGIDLDVNINGKIFFR